jgi:nucleoside-triphosphatase THEP1
MIEKSAMTKEQSSELRDENDKVFFPSSYKFFNTHRGIRPGKLHTFLGMPGVGKSTMRNSIIQDLSYYSPDKKFFVWLSEESEKDFKTSLTYDSIISRNENILIYSEHKNLELYDNLENAKEHFKDILSRSMCDVFIFDNITTSQLYGENFNRQAKVSMLLKQVAIEMNIPFILFAHTGSGISESAKQLIDLNNIRGAKTIVNLSEFFYVMQMFKVGEDRFSTLRLCKSRNQPSRETMFILEYSEMTRTYIKAPSIQFKKFAQFYKDSNKL